MSDLEAIPSHTQFLLMNTTKQQYDDYVTYTGVTVRALLDAAGVNLSGAEGITVYAPDGFGKDFSMDEINNPFTRGTFYQTPGFNSTDEELVNYPATLPDYVVDNAEIPDILRLMFAYKRDGEYILDAVYDKNSGKLNGEGPYRLVKPQDVPNRPNRSVKLEPYNDSWDFDNSIEHNAGSCVRAACVIRINPMPENLEEFDWKNGWSLVEDGSVIIYGYGIE